MPFYQKNNLYKCELIPVRTIDFFGLPAILLARRLNFLIVYSRFKTRFKLFFTDVNYIIIDTLEVS